MKRGKTIVYKLIALAVVASIVAGEIANDGMVSEAKTINIEAGGSYRLPKKATCIKVYNKKVIRVKKNKVIKARLSGVCRVTYKIKNKKKNLRIKVVNQSKKICTNKNVVSSQNVTAVTVTSAPTTMAPAGPTATPWGGSTDYDLPKLVITDIRKAEDNKVIVSFEEIDDSSLLYTSRTGAWYYKLTTKTVKCEVSAEKVKGFKVGDYVNLYFYTGIGHSYYNVITIDDKESITYITNVYDIRTYTPQRKGEEDSSVVTPGTVVAPTMVPDTAISRL